MQLSNFVFPHPVLSKYTDDIVGSINCEQSIIEKTEDYSVSFNYELDNEQLLSLLNEGKATNICEVQCSATMYRRIHSTTEDEIELKIPRKHVRGRVELECFLISNNKKTDYKVDNCHPDYAGYDFEIEDGDLLAYYGKFSFNADIRYQKLKAVSSFLEIEPDDVEIAEFILEEPKIIVKLPREYFEKYAQTHIGRNKEFSPIFHSSIVFSALLHALHNIKDHSERTWAEVIRTRMEEEKLSQLSLEDKSDIPRIAQQLLGKPVSRLIEGLDHVYTNRY